MFDIKKEEQEIQNNLISFPDFMRLFTNKNPDVSLKKIVRFIDNKIPGQYCFNVVFVEDDFLKIEDASTSNFWNYLFSFENSETLGKDAELYIDNADFDGYYLYKNEVTSLLDIPSELLDKNLLPISKSDTITNNNNPDEIARLNAIIEQQAETIAGLEAEAENLSKPDIPTAESAVKSDEIKQYNHVERNTHLQIIGGLVEILAEKVGKFKHGSKINISGIAQEIDKVTVDYEDRAKERTIRARLTEALKKIGNEHTESP